MVQGKRQQMSDLKGQVLKPADLVGYQQGSIVSRTIIDKEAGTLTLFAFDKGQGLSEHTAPFDALVHILDGEAEVTISGKPNNLKEGQMIIMPANNLILVLPGLLLDQIVKIQITCLPFDIPHRRFDFPS